MGRFIRGKRLERALVGPVSVSAKNRTSLGQKLGLWQPLADDGHQMKARQRYIDYSHIHTEPLCVCMRHPESFELPCMTFIHSAMDCLGRHEKPRSDGYLRKSKEPTGRPDLSREACSIYIHT